MIFTDNFDDPEKDIFQFRAQEDGNLPATNNGAAVSDVIMAEADISPMKSSTGTSKSSTAMTNILAMPQESKQSSVADIVLPVVSGAVGEALIQGTHKKMSTSPDDTSNWASNNTNTALPQPELVIKSPEDTDLSWEERLWCPSNDQVVYYPGVYTNGECCP